MSAVVGIDLGTTNTVVAHVDGQRAVALPDENGIRLIPSVVSFHPSGQVIVGRAAKERRLIDARNTVYSIKRLIGRAWASDDVRRAKERSPFELREGPGHAVLVVARGETYTLSEISAYVLRKAKAVAEAALGTTVDRAVITVPANFNDLQRAATKVAGRVAGLEVMRILNEPTAAALAYGYGKSNAERIAVYDFGGGTFDVTLLDLSGNVFEVLATAGDTFLGGDDVDLLIADRMCEAFLKEHRYDPRTDTQVFERVRAAAEDLKHALSTQPQVSIDLKEITFGAGGKALGLHFTMSQAELDKLIRPLVERSFAVCRDAITTARMNPKDFDQVILVGGSTRIPLVRNRVAEFFGREPLANVSPDEVVAIGAAIQAMALSQTDRRRTASNSVVSEMPEERGSSADRQKIPTLGGLGETARQAAQRPGSKTAGGLGEQAKQAQQRVSKTDGGLGEPAKQAQRAGRVESGQPQVSRTNPGLAGALSMPGPLPTTARGMGNPRDPRVDYEEDDDQTAVGQVLPIVVPTAFTERAPNTADFAPGATDKRADSPASFFSPDAAAQLPRRPPPNLQTKLSLGADARAALGRDEPAPPPGAGRTDDSVMASLPLIGVGINRAETIAEIDAPPADAPLKPARTQPLEAQAPLAFDLFRGAPIATAPDDWEDQPTPFATEEQLGAPHASGPAGPEPSFEGPTKVMDRLPSLVAAEAGLPPQPRAVLPQPPPASPQAPPPAPPRAPPAVGLQTVKLEVHAPPPPPARPAAPSISREAPPGPPPRAEPVAPARPGTTTAVMPVPDLTPPPAMEQRFGLSSGRNISMPPAAPPQIRPQVPLLLDVTPLSLCVETVGGYCDVIISRNTPIPCDGTRVFVTAQSFQKIVRVRVAQGESARFHENTQLGEVELSGLREALRGEVEITVTFELDSDGLLQVRARDSATGHEAQTRLRFIGAQDAGQSAESRARQDRQVVV